MQTLWQDLLYALRQLRNAPGFTATAIVTLALGLGVTATVFSVARQVLLAPLPYPQPQQLVGVSFNWPGEGPNAEETGESATFLMRNSHSFQASVLMHDSSGEATLSDGHGRVSNLAVQSVSEGYFRTLGTGPALGRPFTANEDRPGGPQALVLSHALWQRQFGGDPSIVGRTVRLDQRSVTVVGVMPASFHTEAYTTQTTLGSPDAWKPLQVGPQDPGYVGHNYQMWARLRPGVTLAQAQAESPTLEAALYRAFPHLSKYQNEANQLPHVHLYSLAAVIASDAHSSLLVMAAAVSAVLLLTCLNLAGLNIARALRRAPEMALRAALGASRGRLLRLAALEVALLTIAGGAGAVLVARLLLPLLISSSPVAISQLTGTASFGVIAAITASAACLSALLFGAPMALLALRQSRPNAFSGTRTSGTTKRQASAGKLLIAVQMSLAVVLLSAASLLLGTFLKLRSQPLGFSPKKLVVFQTSLKSDRYATSAATRHFAEQVLTNLRNTPGVRSASAVSGFPLQSELNTSAWPDVRTNLMLTTEFLAVTPEYFRTMGIPVLSGRGFSDGDTAKNLPVALISAQTARTWWPNSSPVGRELHLGAKTAYRIVGIVADVPGRLLAVRPDVLVYAPIAQQDDKTTKMLNGWFPMSFALRLAANGNVAKIAAQAVASADPEIPVAKLATMQQVIDTSIAAPRFFSQLAEAFAGFAVLLTAIGLFGLLSYQVTQRTRELGVRMALGASRGRILGGVLLASGILAALGGAAGLLGAALLQPLLSRWILDNVLNTGQYGKDLLFNNAAALALSACALALVSIAAAYLPARKASRVDPMKALRAE